MRSKHLFLPALALLLAMIACNLPGLVPVVTSPPLGESTITETPDIGVPPLGESTVTETPDIGGPPLLTEQLPAGFITAELGGGSPIKFFFHDMTGSITGTVTAPSLQNAGTENVFPIGGVTGGTLPALVYYTYDGNKFLRNDGGSESLLANPPQFYAMTGAPGLPVIAYGTADLTGSGLNTSLFVGAPETATSAGPALTYTADPDGAIIPLRIIMEGGSPSRVWFTKRMYGIGGDLVFDPSSGLYHFDLATLTAEALTLPGGVYSPSLSPDANWVAYNDQGVNSPSKLNIRQLVTGETHTFALLADSDRGAGGGVFSPDGLHLAWLEGHGWLMSETPDFRPTVRLGATDGTTLGDYPTASFDAAAGFSVYYSQPLGWLDDQKVLVQATSSDGAQTAVLSLALDGSISLLSNGSFSGFTYP